MAAERVPQQKNESAVRPEDWEPNERVARLLKTTTALTAVLTTQDAIGAIVQQGVVAMNASAGFLSLLADDGRHFEMAGSIGYDEKLVRRWRRTMLTAATPTADAVLKGEAIWLESSLALAEEYPYLAARPSLTGSRAFVALPLRADGRTVGVLGLSFDRDQVFGAADRAFMLALAQQCALALERARLYEAERAARKIAETAQARLTFLAGASSALSASLDFETTLRRAVRQIVPLLADWCAIDMAEGDGPPRRAIVARIAPSRSKAVRALRCSYLLDPTSAKAVDQVLQSGKASLSPQLSPTAMRSLTSKAGDFARLQRLPAISRMILPLTVHGQVLGAITCVAAESGRIYGSDDLTLAGDLARRIALAIDNSQLYQATQEAEQRSRRQAVRLQLLGEVARHLAEAALDLPTLLAAIIRPIVGMFGDGCVLFQLTSGGQELQPIAIQHADPAHEATIRQILSDHPPQAGKHLGCEGATAGTGPTFAQPQGIFETTTLVPGYRTTIVLLPNPNLSGILAIVRDASWSPLDADDQLFLQDLADRAALALVNNELHSRLADREESLRDLVGRLIASQEEERRRVAYEVHDGLAQIAVAAHQHLQAFARQHYPRSPEGRAALDRVLALAQQAVDEARQVIANLRPTVLDDFGLASALGQQVEALQRAGWQVTYYEDLGQQRLAAPLETALFRVAQEALNNVRKHAQTTKVRITLDRDPHRARLTVQDWGCGFAIDGQSLQAGPGERVGLPGMRERVALVGGQCAVESEIGVGTRIIVEIPLQ
jgi:signal transduction histidine kinase